MKKILLLLIISSSISSIAGDTPRSASMDDASSMPTQQQSLPLAHKCCMNGCVYPTCIAYSCIIDTVACPKRTFYSNAPDPFVSTKIFCTMWLDSLRNGK